jgi:hypothetical protein
VTPARAAGEERGEIGGGLRVGVREATGERQLVDVGVGTGLEAGEGGQQRGVGGNRARQEVGGDLAAAGSAWWPRPVARACANQASMSTWT